MELHNSLSCKQTPFSLQQQQQQRLAQYYIGSSSGVSFQYNNNNSFGRDSSSRLTKCCSFQPVEVCRCSFRCSFLQAHQWLYRVMQEYSKCIHSPGCSPSPPNHPSPISPAPPVVYNGGHFTHLHPNLFSCIV